jgi:hypothetical protein
VRTLLVLSLVVVVFGCRLGLRSSNRELAERFVEALEGRSEASVATFLAPEVRVFLQGTSDSISAHRFVEYLDQRKRNHQAFRASSRVFMTQAGAGWLADFRYLDHGDAIGPPPSRPSEGSLWMETSIEHGSIARVWVLFTVETLAARHQKPEDYQSTMAALGVRVPDGWLDGTPALFS